MLWVPLSQGTWDRDGYLLFYSPLRSPSLPITAPKRLKLVRSVQIVTSRQKPPVCVFLWCVEVLSPMSAVRPPCLSVCASACAHLHSATHASVRLQTSHRGLVLWQGRWKGGGVFFLAVENGGKFYDPCSLSSCKNHTSRFPALQHHRLRSQWKQWSVWRRNKANKEEKKKSPLGRKYLQVYFIHIHHPFPSHQTPR